MIHAQVGEHNLAMDWLERAYRERNYQMVCGWKSIQLSTRCDARAGFRLFSLVSAWPGRRTQCRIYLHNLVRPSGELEDFK